MNTKNILFGLLLAGMLVGGFACSTGDPNNVEENNSTNTNTNTNTETAGTGFNTNSTDSTFANSVVIAFDSISGATVESNPYASSGVVITVSGGDVAVTSTTTTAVNYVLKGYHSDGMFTISSSNAFQIVLNGLSLINNDGPAINVTSAADASVYLVGTTNNRLVDNNTSTVNATLYSKGNLTLSGSGNLWVSGYAKHAIASAANVTMVGGAVTVAYAYKDAVHAANFSQTGGSLTITSAVAEDGVDVDGEIAISGGSLVDTITTADTKGLKATETVTLAGGTVNLLAQGAQSKAVKGGQVDITGGTHTIVASGDVVLTAYGSGYDPSYCTGIKSDGAVSITGGTTIITTTGKGGKGISADGAFIMSGGTVEVATSGNGATYTNSNGAADAYSSTCVSSDGAMYLYGGTLTATSTGTAGKGLSTDGVLTFGQSTAGTGATVTVKTTGARFLVSGTDYANPKAIKSESNIVINSGTITATTTQAGGEGVECEAVFTMNGGTLTISAYDDAINVASSLTMNGGSIYAYSSNNDGIDCNGGKAGSITINDGVVITSGASSPEAGIDADRYGYLFKGGVLIATGGAADEKPTSGSVVGTVVYSGSLSSGQVIHVANSSGTAVLTYKMPRATSTITISSSALTAGTYTLYRGGSVTGGSSFGGYYTGATYSSSEASSGTFTVSSYSAVTAR